ncbi:MAG: diguanylate cyclase [Pseudomonadota bacterium]
MRFVKFCALSCSLFLAIIYSVAAQNEDNPSEVTRAARSDSALLSKAYALRTSKPKEAESLLIQIERTALSDAEQDTYDYVDAYLLFMHRQVKESIEAYEALAKNGNTKKGRFDAYSSLGSLYAATQNWSAGLRILDYLNEHLSEIDNVESEEQAHMALFNFYSLLGEIDTLKNHIENIPSKKYSKRFHCIKDMQYLASLIELEITTITEADFTKAKNNCQDANESIPVLYIDSQQAVYAFELGKFDEALEILLTHKQAIQDVNYEPLLDDMHMLLGKLYMKRGEYDKAIFHANKVVINTPGDTLITDSDIASFEVLFEVAEARQDYQSALKYYQDFSKAQSLNITHENAKELSIQRARQESAEKSNQIALLDAENSLLRAQADLDAQTASNRLIIICLFVCLSILIGIWIYKRQSYYKILQKTSQSDDLTGISNRRHFVQEARKTLEYCKYNRQQVSLILIDLDDFKSINDTFGHLAGDEALKTATSVIKKICRADDLFGRLGGEEFGILLRGCSIEKAMEIAEICRDRLKKTNQQEEQQFTLTGSFGVVNSDIAGYRFEDLFAAADKALYGAKERGKNTVIKAA